MVVKKDVAVCDVCGHSWLPESWPPKRCGKCKSTAWDKSQPKTSDRRQGGRVPVAVPDTRPPIPKREYSVTIPISKAEIVSPFLPDRKLNPLLCSCGHLAVRHVGGKRTCEASNCTCKRFQPET